MGRLVDGEWTTERSRGHDEQGFDGWVGEDGRFPVEADRYHLYVSRACPWAHRAVLTRRLKGLKDAVSMDVVDPVRRDDGWEFSPEVDGCTPDTANGFDYLRDVYTAADPDYTGRVTVPVLWDTERETIVNNESADIMRMLDVAFDPLATRDVDLYPADRQAQVDETIESVYEVNVGVYRAGFADSQSAHEDAVEDLFDRLDHWESVLADRRYLCGDALTEADVCLFATLFRFDAVYHTHFKCNLRRLVDYPNLWNYAKDVYQTADVSETCNLDHVKRHYYVSHDDLNPTGFVPVGPDVDFEARHDRDRFTAELPEALAGGDA